MLSTFEHLGIFFRSDTESQVKQPISSLLTALMGMTLPFDWRSPGLKCNLCLWNIIKLSRRSLPICGWITQVPLIPWEKESPVSSCRKPKDQCQAVSAEILPCGFPPTFLYALSKGRDYLSPYSSRISSEVKQNFIHINLVGKFLNVAVIINRSYNWLYVNILISKL